MTLTKSQLITAQQAVGYAVMYAKTEAETAEFALLQIEIVGAITRLLNFEEQKKQQQEMGCPFNYCDSSPRCEGQCRYKN